LVTCGVEDWTREGGQRVGCSGKVFDGLNQGRRAVFDNAQTIVAFCA
jgi:hypothetical protein